MEIRSARSGDVTRIGELLAPHDVSPEEWVQRIDLDLAKDDREILVAVVSEKVVGYGQLLRYQPDAVDTSSNPPGWYLAGVTVDPLLRRQGIGRQLTVARIVRAGRFTDTLYYLAEADNEPTLRLHEQLGFVVDSHSAPLPGSTTTGIRCRIDLTTGH